MKIVLDTNVYFSALVFGGVLEEILHSASEGVYSIAISKPLLLELARILKEKAGWHAEQIAFSLTRMEKLCHLVYPDNEIDYIKVDPTDNRVLECAIADKADYIVTGDQKHLLPLKKYQNISILSPREFLIRVVYKV